MKSAILAALALCACAHEPTQVILTNDPRVTSVQIADGAEVYRACYVEGGTTDQGRLYGHDVTFGGCYDRSARVIWINQACDLLATLEHELCHAITSLSVKACDDAHPAKCPTGYQFSEGSQHAGGRL